MRNVNEHIDRPAHDDLTHGRGRPHGRPGFGGRRGPGFPGERPGHFDHDLDAETVRTVRKASATLNEALLLACKTGTDEQREQALAIADQARKDLFGILAEQR